MWVGGIYPITKEFQSLIQQSHPTISISSNPVCLILKDNQDGTFVVAISSHTLQKYVCAHQVKKNCTFFFDYRNLITCDSKCMSSAAISFIDLPRVNKILKLHQNIGTPKDPILKESIKPQNKHRKRQEYIPDVILQSNSPFSSTHSIEGYKKSPYNYWVPNTKPWQGGSPQ